MSLAQYSNVFYLYILLVALVPAIVLGLIGKRIKYYGIIVSLPMALMLIGVGNVSMINFIAFVVGEIILIVAYYFIRKKTTNKYIYYCFLVFSVVPLIFVKSHIYTGINYLGFIGISYISFKVIGMIIEIYDGRIDKLSIVDMFYFITFFPVLSSGPIDRYKRFTDDTNKTISRDEYFEDYLLVGLKRIAIGVLYKFILAYLINTYLIGKIGTDITLSNTIMYMYSYTLYLFFDFAGYSSFAVGTSYILGIKTPMNFDKPFLAKDMKEFWDRWHITLSKWLQDYLFSRFILNAMRNKVFKNQKIAARVGLMLTMITMGLWHGFYVFYLVYGLYQGTMLVLTDIYRKSKFYKKYKKHPAFNIVSRVINFNFIAFGMLLFSGYLFSF